MTVNDEYDNVLFFIYYSKERQKYFIRTNYKHNCKEVEALPHVLAKVKDTCVCFYLFQELKRKQLITINDIFFQIKVKNNNVEIYQFGNTKHKENNSSYNFKLEETKEIRIGRDEDCHIKLNWDKLFSKRQCTLQYDEFLDNWRLIDGKKDHPSRNGVWIFISRSLEVNSGTVFRIGSSRFEATLLD